MIASIANKISANRTSACQALSSPIFAPLNRTNTTNNTTARPKAPSAMGVLTRVATSSTSAKDPGDLFSSGIADHPLMHHDSAAEAPVYPRNAPCQDPLAGNAGGWDHSAGVP